MRNAFQRFMYGRYGNDQLNQFLIIAALVLFVLNLVFRASAVTLVADVLIVCCLFRMLSKNTYKRREENAKFMRKAQPAIKWLRLQQSIRRDKAHRYFKCPNCSQYLRVPRGKGKITVTCRSCGASFQEKS